MLSRNFASQGVNRRKTIFTKKHDHYQRLKIPEFLFFRKRLEPLSSIRYVASLANMRV